MATDDILNSASTSAAMRSKLEAEKNQMVDNPTKKELERMREQLNNMLGTIDNAIGPKPEPEHGGIKTKTLGIIEAVSGVGRTVKNAVSNVGNKLDELGTERSARLQKEAEKAEMKKKCLNAIDEQFK